MGHNSVKKVQGCGGPGEFRQLGDRVAGKCLIVFSAAVLQSYISKSEL